MNRKKKILANVLDLMVVAFVYEEELYNKWMDKVDRLRREDNE